LDLTSISIREVNHKRDGHELEAFLGANRSLHVLEQGSLLCQALVVFKVIDDGAVPAQRELCKVDLLRPRAPFEVEQERGLGKRLPLILTSLEHSSDER
jgi:hypothetical protein